MCIKCKNVRPLVDFTLHTRQKVVAICQTCSNLKLSAIDKSIYKAILRSIRRDERQRRALASYAFIIQEDDIRFLVENIWHGHSALSQNDNRMELRWVWKNILRERTLGKVPHKPHFRMFHSTTKYRKYNLNWTRVLLPRQKPLLGHFFGHSPAHTVKKTTDVFLYH